MSSFSCLEPTAPIGVFDSGLGGLTVVRRLRERLPQESIVYVADQAHVPYGGRDLQEVCGFACGISEALLKFGCKAIVMACNISSATALRTVQARHSEVPVLGVILPGASAAVVQTSNRRIGVLATEGTVKTRAYTQALHHLDPHLHVTEVACPKFVLLVEAGEVATPEAVAACGEYLEPLRQEGVDTTLLGCTHYPFLLPILQSLCPRMCFVDPAEQTVLTLQTLLETANLLTPSAKPPTLQLTTTGDSHAFNAQMLYQFLPESIQVSEIGRAYWEAGRLGLEVDRQ